MTWEYWFQQRLHPLPQLRKHSSDYWTWHGTFVNDRWFSVEMTS